MELNWYHLTKVTKDTADRLVQSGGWYNYEAFVAEESTDIVGNWWLDDSCDLSQNPDAYKWPMQTIMVVDIVHGRVYPSKSIKAWVSPDGLIAYTRRDEIENSDLF